VPLMAPPDVTAGSGPVPADRRLGAPPANSPQFVPAPPSPGVFESTGSTPPPPQPPDPPVPPTGATQGAVLAPAPEPIRTSRVGGGRLLLGVMAAILSIALVATGFALARATDDDGPVATEPNRPVIATVPGDTPTIPPPEFDDTGEPVADVARVVAPSVVLVNVEEFGQGSGIAYTDTLIVTNAHVVGSASDVSVQLSDGREVPGEVRGTDPDRDIAVVEVDASVGLVPASFAPSDSVQVGQLAVAVGSPFGLDQTVTSGVVSAVDRVVPGGLDGGNPVAMVQTDAPINPGNSGGALVDRRGQVIGMNTAIRTETGTFSGVGFAIPSDTITLIAERIVNGETLDIAFLGVTMDDAQGDVVGALIVNVEADSPASAAGLQAGDIVIRLDDIAVTDRGDLAANVRLKNPGDRIEMEFVRDGRSFVVEVALGQS